MIEHVVTTNWYDIVEVYAELSFIFGVNSAFVNFKIEPLLVCMVKSAKFGVWELHLSFCWN